MSEYSKVLIRGFILKGNSVIVGLNKKIYTSNFDIMHCCFAEALSLKRVHEMCTVDHAEEDRQYYVANIINTTHIQLSTQQVTVHASKRIIEFFSSFVLFNMSSFPQA